MGVCGSCCLPCAGSSITLTLGLAVQLWLHILYCTYPAPLARAVGITLVFHLLPCCNAIGYAIPVPVQQIHMSFTKFSGFGSPSSIIFVKHAGSHNGGKPVLTKKQPIDSLGGSDNFGSMISILHYSLFNQFIHPLTLCQGHCHFLLLEPGLIGERAIGMIDNCVRNGTTMDLQP